MAVRKTVEKIDFSELRAIGDVADTLGLPAHVLRFWETRRSATMRRQKTPWPCVTGFGSSPRWSF